MQQYIILSGIKKIFLKTHTPIGSMLQRELIKSQFSGTPDDPGPQKRENCGLFYTTL